jgi:integrase/recombinase XerD
MSTPMAVSDMPAAIADYVDHQRALGRNYSNEERILVSMYRWLAQSSVRELDQASFDQWCDTMVPLGPNTRRARQLMAHKFCLFRQRAEPGCFVPNPMYFARSCPYVRPIIVQPDQVARMLAATTHLAPTPGSPLLPAVVRMAIVLLYTAGLRRGELLRLTLRDIEPASGVLQIRESKFHKSRLVPLSTGAARELRHYLRKRLVASLGTGPETPLLCNTTRGLHGYTGTGISRPIHELFELADVRDVEGRCPRIHDLRHSFAVQALIRWYQEGADVQSNLPKLAMYMGHISIVSTAYYLPFVPTIAALASERFEKHLGHVLGGGKP